MPLAKTIVVCGAGGFIGGHLVKWLQQQYGPLTKIRAVDKKPLCQWYQRTNGVEAICMDLANRAACEYACRNATEVYQLACDMGGMGFIERFRCACMQSVLINTHMLEAAYKAGVQRYFYSSSACAYNIDLQQDPNCRALKESDAYPANAERGYGWEKLFSEIMCQEYWKERGLETHIARFHNVYGPRGTWDGGREKAPAAICRKVIHAKATGDHTVKVWGDGTQNRSYMYIDDCINGINKIMHCKALIATPINLGSSELISVNSLVDLACEIGEVELTKEYEPDAPRGVAGRNSDNTMIRQILGWEPSTPFSEGLRKTYAWIEREYRAGRSGA